jgi:hypothetical protein
MGDTRDARFTAIMVWRRVIGNKDWSTSRLD